MQITAHALAEMVSGQLVGDPDVVVSEPAKIEEASQGQITFLANPKYEEYLYNTEASIVLVGRDFEPRSPVQATLIKVDDVYATLGLLLSRFGNGMEAIPGISETAVISGEAEIADDVAVGPYTIVSDGATIGSGVQIYGQVYIGHNVKIGQGTRIYPGVKIYSNCIIGKDCIIHANAVIGSDGFGFTPTEDGGYRKIDQIGNVILEDNVEIGANTAIDRATMGSTVIHAGAKLDNLIQIAHNVEIGENSVIAALSGIAGSTKIGKNTQIGGQVGIAGHLKMEDGLRIQAGSKVNTNPGKENAKLYGYPAIDYVQYLRAYAIFRKLPELQKRLDELEKQIGKDSDE
ncbi:MAG: UDP-3-O-(3-hydroxymyristoyl)glucosamine N-acyltransferase [Saprospiraceae bacterium]|nr:UDP-3-O-(3-hydroxymyristoyl)glucosamine N-acyltransferase [Saprospiraceae bacterium]